MNTMNRLLCLAAGASLALATPLYAQPAQPTPAPDAPVETRPATTTFFGDTGLWFVPTGEILPHRRASVSGYRANFDYEAGSTDVSHFAITFGYGIADRVELFGSMRVQTRIDRLDGPDNRNPFFGVAPYRGVAGEYPLVREGWSTGVGDLLVGAKFNVLSEHRQQPLALALRAVAKLPTGDDDAGVSTGEADFTFDGVISKELNEAVELSGYAGLAVRGEPAGVEFGNGFRWGFGAGFPTRGNVRMFTELHGERYFEDTVVFTRTGFVGQDGTIPPLVTPQSSPVNLNIGAIWQGQSGVFAGAGVQFNLNQPDDNIEFGSKTGFQFRIGYHPGVRVFAVPPPPPAPPAPPERQPPTVKARCEPCTVEIGKSSTVTADAHAPEGDPLTYKWSAPAGTFANPTDRQTIWTAPNQEGPVPVTVTVDDGRGGTASDTVTIQVVRPAVREFVFEDVHFDFDRYSLRPEATRILDEAVKAMQENPNVRLELEGHTCNIGTAEYNLALGERRANAVRDYLVSRGIGMDRLRTVSYGEERPKHDNAREETRRLNRRAALVVRLQQQ
jgi:outer membrane protein OmpA-like peptidoglycan-associated protein